MTREIRLLSLWLWHETQCDEIGIYDATLLAENGGNAGKIED
jgi:hypothetical protein